MAFWAATVHPGLNSITCPQSYPRIHLHEQSIVSQAILNQGWVVLKFGGTSVAGRPQWQTIRDLLSERLEAGNRVLLVCSAVSGATNRLSELADQPNETSLNAILDTHIKLAAEMNVPTDQWLEAARERMQTCMRKLQQGENHAARADLLATGEWLSTRIGASFLNQTLSVDWLDARNYLIAKVEPELSLARQILSASCAAGFDQNFRETCAGLKPVVITQGFIAADPTGATVLLGRGGSDTSAALLAGRLGAGSVEIWTDVPGLFSADPRLVPEARLLEELEYSEALEMAASGAKVVHPSCIRAAAETGTTVLIRDTGRPQLTGTRIGPQPMPSRGVKNITSQKEMLVLLLQKLDNRREVGFLAGVFDIFRKRGVSIDLVATSETTTTVAINRPANLLDDAALAGLVHDLQELCSVVVYPDCVCVNLVGNSVRTALAQVQTSMEFFNDRALLMLSQSANDLCLSMLMPASEHELLVQQLHSELIVGANPDSGLKFGPSWQDLQHWQ